MGKYKLHKPFKPRKISYKKPHGVSNEETEVLNMIILEFPGTKVYRSNREILHGREIDIYLPDKKLGLEFNGLYYHNSNTKNENYHLSKTVCCELQGIQLIHIFSDEWEMKKSLVIDLIRKTLGKYQEINYKDCKAVKLTKAEGHNFIDNCDLTGDDISATDYVGLLYNNDLVAVMSYKETEDETVILKYAERKSIKVFFGVYALLELIDSDKPYKSYVDRRFSLGLDFLDAGFNKIDATNPKPWYTLDYKHKTDTLKLTESEAKEAGYSIIYDCGSLVFTREPLD